MNRKLLIPLGVFAVLSAFLLVGLGLNPREVPSPLIGKPAPAFVRNQLHAPDKTMGTADMKGQVWLLNVWASWCVACREEHPLLVDFARRKVAPIYGLNYKDGRPEAMRWLANFGNPYTASVSHAQGKVGIDFGVYGVPETFVIDKRGTSRFKQIGPVTPDVLKNKIEPLLKQLQAENAPPASPA